MVWSFEPSSCARIEAAPFAITGSTPSRKGVEFDMDVDSDFPRVMGDLGINPRRCSNNNLAAMPSKFHP